MLTVQIRGEMEQRLGAIVQETGRTADYLIERALEEYPEDLEDIVVAEQRLAEIEAGTARVYSLQEVEKELGLDS